MREPKGSAWKRQKPQKINSEAFVFPVATCLSTMSQLRTTADGGGFEPPGRDRRPLVFKTSSFGRSDNHPDEVTLYLLRRAEA